MEQNSELNSPPNSTNSQKEIKQRIELTNRLLEGGCYQPSTPITDMLSAVKWETAIKNCKGDLNQSIQRFINTEQDNTDPNPIDWENDPLQLSHHIPDFVDFLISILQSAIDLLISISDLSLWITDQAFKVVDRLEQWQNTLY